MTSQRRLSHLIAVCVALVAFLAGAAPVSAHDGHDSMEGSTVVEVGERRVIVTALVGFGDLGYADTSDDRLIDPDELAEQEAAAAPTLVSTVREHVDIIVDGKAVEIIGAGVPSTSEFGSDEEGASPWVTLVFATGPHDGDVSDIELGWGFDDTPTTVVVAHADGTITGELDEDDTIAVSLDIGSDATSFFDLGVAQTAFVLLVIVGIGVYVRLAARRAVWARAAVVASAALVGVVWTMSRLAELPA